MYISGEQNILAEHRIYVLGGICKEYENPARHVLFKCAPIKSAMTLTKIVTGEAECRLGF